MIKNVLCDIGGIGLYGIISICLFFAVFGAAVVWALAQKKSTLNSVSTLPLNDGEIPSKAKGNSHE
jgi:hypothetical protein